VTGSTGSFVPDQPLLEPEEVAFIVALRGRLANVERLHQASQDERHEWERTYGPEEPYIALDHKGGDAYGAAAEALVETAVGAFDLVARALGVTGWQASYAELEFLRRSRGIKGPFGLYSMEDALYPQYDLHQRLRELRWSDETVRWLGDCAEYALAARGDGVVAARVADHWRWLVAQRDAHAKGHPGSPDGAA
jgi:hypothetical protein